MRWGHNVLPRLTHAVRLELNHDERVARVIARQHVRYGDAILPGGTHHDAHNDFMGYVLGYDSPTYSGKNVAKLVPWFEALPCKQLALCSDRPPHELAADVVAWVHSCDTDACPPTADA